MALLEETTLSPPGSSRTWQDIGMVGGIQRRRRRRRLPV
jgi:hypothetical protein